MNDKKRSIIFLQSFLQSKRIFEKYLCHADDEQSEA